MKQESAEKNKRSIRELKNILDMYDSKLRQDEIVLSNVCRVSICKLFVSLPRLVDIVIMLHTRAMH